MGQIVDMSPGSFSCVSESSHGARSHWDSSKSSTAGSAGKFLSEADREAIRIADKAAEQVDLAIEVVDIGRSFWTRMKYLFKGIVRTPRFFVGGKAVPTVISADQLLSHIQ
jgi:hypothetical protein